jgi:hypothetical protein
MTTINEEDCAIIEVCLVKQNEGNCATQLATMSFMPAAVTSLDAIVCEPNHVGFDRLQTQIFVHFCKVIKLQNWSVGDHVPRCWPNRTRYIFRGLRNEDDVK